CRVDALLAIDDAMDVKCRMLDCHVSQVYEWLAWGRGLKIDPQKMSWEERKEYLLTHWGSRYVTIADTNRDKLCALYGEAGKSIRYAEAFEFSPYGRKITIDEFKNEFQDLMTP
ncbi:MAG: hypothetical protein J6R86_09070, partial [Lentisphaeria bacterium]|nr:hypothetical protein [Lentisphaeria bacterium]